MSQKIVEHLKQFRSYDRQDQPYQSLDGLSRGVRKTNLRAQILKLPENFKGASVLDLGCNTGAFCFEAKKRKAGRVVGIEYSLRPLSIAQEINLKDNLGIQFLQVNLNDGLLNLVQYLGLYKFDYIFALSIWKHIYDQTFWSVIKAYTKKACWLELNAVHDGHHYGEDLKNFLRKNKNNREVISELLLKKSGAREVIFLGNSKDQGKRGCYLIIYENDFEFQSQIEMKN